MRKPYLLLTGATGLLGRYLLRDLLAADALLAVVVRPTRWESAVERVEAVISRWEAAAGRALPRPVVLTGDINQPSLGLAARELDWAADHCGSMIHSAASLTFYDEEETGEPWRSNVEGTRNVLDLCNRVGIANFHHVSTAYVAGLRQDLVREDELNVGQELGNDYERSKITAEQEVRDAEFLTCVTVHRPSIIIGDSETGYTNTYHGFYSPLRFAHSLLGNMQADDLLDVDFLSLLGLDGHERKNFVPVDWVSAVMAHVVTHPELHGKTYHLTSPAPVTVLEMRQVFEEVLVGYLERGAQKAAAFSTEADFGSAFKDQMKVYQAYWRDDPRFDSTNAQSAAPHLPCPRVDRDMLLRLSRYAIDHNFGWPREPIKRLRFSVADVLKRTLGEVADADVCEKSAESFNLVVTGEGGGNWQVQIEANGRTTAQLGISGKDAPTVHLSSTTFEQIVAGDAGLDRALREGRIVCLGNVEHSASWRQFFAQVAPSDPVPAAAG